MSSKHPATVLTVKAVAVIEILHMLGIFSGVIKEQTPEWVKALVQDNHSLVILFVGILAGFLLRGISAVLWRKLFKKAWFAKLIIGTIPAEALKQHSGAARTVSHGSATRQADGAEESGK